MNALEGSRVPFRSHQCCAPGITHRSIRFIYLPMCLANARGNPCVGLGQFLTVLAELLELLK
eukprot:429578-Amphidinium_carterae.1